MKAIKEYFLNVIKKSRTFSDNVREIDCDLLSIKKKMEIANNLSIETTGYPFYDLGLIEPLKSCNCMTKVLQQDSEVRNPKKPPTPKIPSSIMR